MGMAEEYKAKNIIEWDARYHVQNLKISMYCTLLCVCVGVCVRLAGGQKLLIGKLMLRQSLRAQSANKGIDNGILTHTRLHIFVYTHSHTLMHLFIVVCCLSVLHLPQTVTPISVPSSCLLSSSYQLQLVNLNLNQLYFPQYFAALPCLNCSQLWFSFVF